MTDFKILTFQTQAGPRAGILVDDRVIDVAAATGRPEDASVLSLLERWPTAKAQLEEIAKAPPKDSLPLAGLKLRAPVLYPPAIYCAGANYKDHAEEMSAKFNRPLEPDPHTQGLRCFFFIKSGRTVADPEATIAITPLSKTMDWEIELAAVIGKTARNVSQEQALECIAAYTIGNDLSARDFARRPHIADISPFKADWVSHKNFDDSCPLGPYLTPADQIRDPHNLAMKLTINDVVKQDSNSGRMIFNINEQIAHLSARVTLHPGDVVMTGTPAGVGAARGEFLKAGDRVSLSIEGLGTLTNVMA